MRFNPAQRDIILSNGDLDIATDLDTGYQNGMILANCPAATPLYPPLGLSLVDSIGSGTLEGVVIRWQNMVRKDGAQSVNYEIINNSDVNFTTTY